MANKKEGILLETGTNEIEIMKFCVLGEYYGINVVEGFFKPRDTLITVINLATYLSGEPQKPKEGARDLFIITNFNKMMVAFRVDSIEGISRISWKNISKPDKTLENGDDSIATGIAQCDDELVTILDFEKIVAEIAPETSIKVSEIDKLGARNQNDSPIVIAEDSVLLQKMIKDSLAKAGYANVTVFNNGLECWNYLQNLASDPHVYDQVNLVITDLEMPMMDGHRLTKLIKDDQVLKNIPVVIFSSLINEQMFLKGKEVGADEQLSKPEIGHLVTVIDGLLARYRENRASGFKS